MDVREIFDRAEKLFHRLHFIHWALFVLPALTAASLFSGWWAKINDFPWLLIALTALGGFVLAVAVIIFLMWAVDWVLLKRDRIPLKTAARLAYEQTRGTVFAQTHTGESQSPSEKLKTYADIMLMSMTTYGKEPPSELYEEISERNRNRYHILDNDCDTLGDVMDNRPRFVGLRVSKRELKGFIQSVKTTSKGL